MNHKLTFNLTLVAALCLSQSHFSISLANKAKMLSQPPLRATEEREDYQQCLATAIKKDKAAVSDPAQKARTKRALANCRDRYPAVSLLVECKREMTLAYRDNPNDLKAALQQCREDYKKLSLSATNPLPFIIKDKLIFFAGAGLNHSVLLREKDNDKQTDALYMGENFGNFSCTPLLDSMFERRNPEYLLFGADLHTYPALRHVDRQKLRDAFAWAPDPKAPGTLQTKPHRTMGEVLLNSSDSTVINYFPSAFCFYNRKLEAPYEAFKIYYLLDRKARQATPYFGVAFFRPHQGPDARELAKQMQAALGPEFQILEPKPDVLVVSSSALPQPDAEGDPKNICANEPQPSIVGLVHRPNNTTKADYLLLANTRNLCRFGDRMASRFLRSGLKMAP